ncbi:MAG: hypothetical protein R3E21_07930 [Caenibius sp.]
MAARKSRAPVKQESKSGYWFVTLNAPFPIPGFLYRPGVTHRVNEKLLARMQAEDGLIAHVEPAA